MTVRTALSMVAAVLVLGTGNASANLLGTISDGSFSNPSPTCPPSVCSGVGTNTFTWGTELNQGTGSQLVATGNAFNTPLGTPFVMAHLFFSNAQLVVGTEVGNISVTFNTGSITANGGEDPTLYANLGLSLVLDIINTPNTDDPLASADIIRIHNSQDLFRLDPNAAPVDEFHVLEGAATSVEILGIFGSFGAVGFGAVADPSLGFVSSSVPMPSSLALLGVGILVVMLGLPPGHGWTTPARRTGTSHRR